MIKSFFAFIIQFLTMKNEGNTSLILPDDQLYFLLKFKWWDKNEEWLIKNVKDFHNIDKFIHAYNRENS